MKGDMFKNSNGDEGVGPKSPSSQTTYWRYAAMTKSTLQNQSKKVNSKTPYGDGSNYSPTLPEAIVHAGEEISSVMASIVLRTETIDFVGVEIRHAGDRIAEAIETLAEAIIESQRR